MAPVRAANQLANSPLLPPKAKTNLHIFSVIISSRDGVGAKTDGWTPNYVIYFIVQPMHSII